MQVGQQLQGGYTVAEFLGEGGMGLIFRAEDPGGNSVAIKVLRAEIAATPKLVARFRREAGAQAMLTHPNIAALHAVGSTEAGELFFVMELVWGESLADMLEAGPRPVADAIAIIRQLLSALHYAHQFGMVHRDLKPENVLLDHRGGDPTVKLIDFGLVKLLQNVLGSVAPETLTWTGSVFGTPQYMPPEQILGSDVDARTDLYAVGIMLFEAIAGRPPFESAHVPELWELHLRAPIPSLREHAKTPIPEDLDAIIQTLLAKSPDERFESALAAARALDAIDT